MQKGEAKYINAVKSFYFHFPTSTLNWYGIIVLYDAALYTWLYIIICYRMVMSNLNS